ncbi:MAG: biosynthetic peptidoglycan transglycosylase [Bacteroides sp.]|nr:biosynthetic peptidoglycan transglycosylase [Bacteroides sp.]
MERQKRPKAVILLGLLFLLAIIGYALRGCLLRSVADRRIARLEQRYGLNIGYTDLGMKGLSTVSVSGLTVVPDERDTLLSLQSLDVDLSLWMLLRGHVYVESVQMDSLLLRFTKHDSVANYDFLFLPPRPTETDAPAAQSTKQPDTPTDYCLRTNRLLGLLFNLLPGNAELTRLHITEQKNSNFVALHIPRFSIHQHRFRSSLSIREDSLSQQWTTEGELNPSEHRIHATLRAPQLTVPYIRRRFGIEATFDSLTCSLQQELADNSHSILCGQAEVGGLHVYHRRLSPEVINLDHGLLDFRLNIHPHGAELDSSSLVRFNALEFHPYLRAERTQDDEGHRHWHLTASVSKPWFPSDELFSSLPKGLFSNLEGLRTDGQLCYHGLLDVDFACPDSLRLESSLKGKDFRILAYGQTNLGKMSEEFEYTAYEDGVPVRTFPIGPSWNHFTPLDEIPARLQMSVMQSEDGAFFYHQGFLPDAMREALIQDLKEHRFARGGSTISMQLVKNVFLNRNKNIARKLEEALIVWLIETEHLTSKQRMYEVYLNIAEWGPMVYGIHEAAEFYFDKRPSQLSLEECIYLASIIPRPKHFKYSFTPAGTLRESQEGYFRLIAGRLAQKGIITEEQASQVDISRVRLKGAARAYFETE